jgi:alkanesulfonate monooxygenase SsuD/methylene tetrahydromethanopterin reductase-like flavin-dependent oxidoreductase (luciferase family)
VEFGIQTGQQHRPFREILGLWQLAERIGYSYGWLYDHLVPVGGDLDGEVYESWSALATLLARTERIRGGILVTCVMFRPPAILAKTASTIDVASEGRLEFGIGACWNAWESDLYGVPFPKLSERLDRLDEAISVVRTMWDPTKENFDGLFYKVSAAHVSPMPAQSPHPRIWVGGWGRTKMPNIIARQADGWNAIFLSFEEYQARLIDMRRACEEVGRDPSTLGLSFGQRVSVDADERRAEARAIEQYERNGVAFDEQLRSRFIFGTPLQVAEKINAFKELGVDQFILWHELPFDSEAEDQIRQFSESVMPLVR